MTCIVAVKHDNGVVLAGDSCSSTHYFKHNTMLSKVFHVDPNTMIGYCGSFRMGQLLEHKLKMPKREPGVSDIEYVVLQVIEEIRRILKLGGITKIEHEVEEGGSFILCYKNEAYYIWEDFQVNPTMDSYLATGSGMEYALGSLYTTAPSEGCLSSEKAIDAAILAIEAASHHSPFVGGPIDVICTKGE